MCCPQNLLHWTETAAPYRVGDTTFAAEANRLLFSYAIARPMCATTLHPARVLPIDDDAAQL